MQSNSSKKLLQLLEITAVSGAVARGSRGSHIAKEGLSVFRERTRLGIVGSGPGDARFLSLVDVEVFADSLSCSGDMLNSGIQEQSLVGRYTELKLVVSCCDDMTTQFRP